jgi:choline dehydrogenase
MDEFDYVIVGAGAAGCVLAARLSEDPRVRVGLLEAGPPDRRREIAIPAAFAKLFRSEVDWGFSTAAEDGLDGREVFFPRGRTLGGSTSINAQMYVRGRRDDFDAWGPGWSYEDLLPYFRRAEDNARGPDGFHGVGGPLRVEDQRDPNPLTVAFCEAAVQAGIPANPDVNGAEQDGVGLVQVTQHRGRRFSAADAYLRPARRRRNLSVLTGAHALELVLDGRRARGVAFRRPDGSRVVARARREVLLCAGAIGSPQLLMLSGIGPAEHLRAYGLEVVRDLPGVGQNLVDHPIVGSFFATDRPVTLFAAERPRQLAAWLFRRRGLLSSNVGEAVAFARTRPGLTAPDLELVFCPVLFVDEGLAPPPRHGFTVAAAAVDPASRGQVALRSSDPLTAPAIRPGYLSDPDGADLAVLVHGLRLARRIVRAPALRHCAGAELGPGPHARSDEELAAWIRPKAQSFYHPVGTCALGEHELAVVDRRLRVHGVDALRVIDASVMPRIVRGHTQAATIAIAERGAELIRSGPAPPSADSPAPAAEPQTSSRHPTDSQPLADIGVLDEADREA